VLALVAPSGITFRVPLNINLPEKLHKNHWIQESGPSLCTLDPGIKQVEKRVHCVCLQYLLVSRKYSPWPYFANWNTQKKAIRCLWLDSTFSVLCSCVLLEEPDSHSEHWLKRSLKKVAFFPQSSLARRVEWRLGNHNTQCAPNIKTTRMTVGPGESLVWTIWSCNLSRKVACNWGRLSTKLAS
jgi:hypothetical protein